MSGWDGWLHSLSLFGFSRRTGEHFARELLCSSLRSLFSRFSFENEERSECKSLKGYTLVFLSVSTIVRVCSLFSLKFVPGKEGKIARDRQRLPEIARDCQRLPEIGKDWERLVVT